MSNLDSINISFLGGASGIGASCILVRVPGACFVVDCGVRYSGASPLPDLAQLAEVRVDAILVTHAHMDHSGGLPVLAEACPGAPVFATAPTIDLVGILLRDSLRLMNAPDRESEVPLYTESQVEQLFHSMTPVKYHQPIRVGEIEICWLPASHILGAGMILMKTPAGTILFTGDYSVTAQQTVPGLARPDFRADLVVSESTYGQRLHEDRNAAEERLLEQVRQVVERGGRVLIPAFAVGRAQEILLILKRALRNGSLPETPIFVDGMVRAVCDIYRRHEAFVSRQLVHEIRRTPHAFYTDSIRPITSREDRTRALATRPCILVASSGMLAGGPSAGYCQELAKTAGDAVLLTGYQDEESPGRALLDLAHSDGPKELRLGQATVPVACDFGTYGLSAHADRMQMVSWIEAVSPRTVVLVHGDEDAKQTLARSLQCSDVLCARDGSTIERSYPPRKEAGRKRPTPRVPTVDELDVDRARNLLGPAGEAPVRAAAVAEAWFGQVVDRAAAEQFARVLETVGLVRRDDHRRDRLWVLGVGESGLFPDEAELEEELKQANPKGRLLEFCMRMRLDLPVTETSQEGAFFEANMTLFCPDQALASGPFRAASKKTAEQLAARALLDMVSQDSQDGEVAVGEDDAARLQATNPKGRLLEWCMKAKLPAPEFQRDASPGGYRIRVVLSLEDEEIATDWHTAQKLKIAEQAAAEAALGRLPSEPEPDLPAVPTQPQPPVETVAAAPTGRNPVMVLNELTQAGLLGSSGYELVDQSGPSHQPTFAFVAWAKLPDGRTLRTEPTHATSKKAAQRAAGERMVDLLVAEGVTRR